jgi:CRP-like cAMP-binding protein
MRRRRAGVVGNRNTPSVRNRTDEVDLAIQYTPTEREEDPALADPSSWAALTAQAGLDHATLWASCQRRRFARGEVVFHEGDPAGSLHLLERGRVSVQLTTPFGDVAIVDVLRPGDAFGEQSLVDGVGLRTATVTALEKVETLALDAQTFANLRTTNPGLDRFLLMVVATRLRATSQQLLEALYIHADVRVLRCVCRLCDVFDVPGGGQIPMTQADVASMAGVNRSTANRVLTHVQACGALALRRGHIEVLDMEMLRRLSHLPPVATGSRTRST